MRSSSAVIDLPRRIVLAMVGFTLPFEHTSFDLGPIPLTPNKAVAALLVGLVALQWAIERRPLPRDPKRVWVLVFGLAVGVSALQAFLTLPKVDAVRGVSQTVVALLIFYFVMTYSLRRRLDLDVVLRWFVLGCAVTVISGWLGFGTQIESGVRSGARLAGEGSSPNLLAFNLLVAIAGGAALYFSARGAPARAALLGLLALLTTGVVATLSRSAYVALPLMSALWAVRLRRVGFLKYAVPGVLLVALAAMLAPETAVERASTLRPEEISRDESARGRIEMIPSALRAFASNPVTGVGLQGYIPWAVENDAFAHGIHNAFLQVLAENGLLGFVPFVAIVVLSWREFTRAWRLARRAGGRRDLELRALEIRALLLQVGLGGALVMSLAQPSMHHKSLWLLFALSSVVMGLVQARAREVQPAPERPMLAWEPGFAARARLDPGLDSPAR
jgi:O-antigen ligase